MLEAAYDVIYLTGSPASGKSTLLRALAGSISPLIPFSYSAELAKHIESTTGAAISEVEIRTRSAKAVTPKDVAAVDQALLTMVAEKRDHSHIVIDSHAVTKESYGLRVTPFSKAALRRLAPTVIVCLYTPSEAAIERIRLQPAGRPEPTPFEADLHTHLQCSVALSYSLELGLPCYFLDSTRPVDVLVDQIKNRLAAVR